MSLINQALKKEQRKRSGDIDSLPPAAAMSPQVRRRSSGNKNSALLLLLCGGGLALTLAIVGVIYFGSQLFNFSGPNTSSATLASLDESTTDIVEGSEEKEDVETSHLLDDLDLEELSETAEANGNASTAKTKEPEGDPIVQSYVDNLVFHGVRSAGENSRLLLNGRVYRVGDIMDPRKGVRFTGVVNEKIRFEDENGAVYLRSK